MYANIATSTFVPIQGTFDIAQARSSLRLKIAHQHWPTVFNARAATALTALGELILALGKSQPVLIRITFVEQFGKRGIELWTELSISDESFPQWEARKHNLERAASDILFSEAGDNIEITAYVWVE